MIALSPDGAQMVYVANNRRAIETGRLLAILLDAGRITVGANQSLINDPSKGDKGFTPEVFEKELIERFRERTRVDLAGLMKERTGANPASLKNDTVSEMAKKMLPQLLVISKSVVAEYQPVINRQGMAYKGFIPATFGTRVAAKFRANFGVYIKQTTYDGLLRNPKNKADIFETEMLEKLADPAYPRKGDKIMNEAVDGGKSIRVMLPLFYNKGCLSCHGGPKGELDISGYMKEGAKEGDLGGAISVWLNLTSVP
jgi:general secretion pathway protein A